MVLVGSEGGSTWGFAATLAKGLRAAGQSVHIAPMSGFTPARYAQADRFVILAATYGEGDAPAPANGFLDAMAALPSPPAAPVAVLGFGDRSFPAFCAFAEAVEAVEAALRAKGWASLLPMDTVDRQSPQDFARWGQALGTALGIPLDLLHQPVQSDTQTLALVSRLDYGAEVQVPMTILRFALPKLTLWQRLTGQGLAGFQAGDLLGILPDGSPLPRLYSLASGAKDGFVEIVVRKHPGGLASGQLTALKPGSTVCAFLRRKRPIHLVFGLRNPDSDFLYGDDLALWQADGRLAHRSTAASRAGAKVMVCGGRDMAQGVTQALADILQPAGLTPAQLKAEWRYIEDVY